MRVRQAGFDYKEKTENDLHNGFAEKVTAQVHLHLELLLDSATLLGILKEKENRKKRQTR